MVEYAVAIEAIDALLSIEYLFRFWILLRPFGFNDDWSVLIVNWLAFGFSKLARGFNLSVGIISITSSFFLGGMNKVDAVFCVLGT